MKNFTDHVRTLLAQGFEHGARKLGQLIKKQDTVVRQRNLARALYTATVIYRNSCDTTIHKTMR